MSGKVYGRAFKITQRDAKAYTRVDRTLRANPIGVTAMASVNGRGAWRRSARAVAAGKTRGQRIERAKEVYRNGVGVSMAGLLKNRRKSTSTKAKKRTSSAKRTKVPGTNYYRTKGGRYQNSKGKFVKASAVKATKAKKTSAKSSASRRKSTATKPVRRKVRRNATVGYSKSYAAGYERMERTKKRRATAAKRKSSAKKSTSRIGKYTRATVVEPRTGKKRVSYLYRTKSGSLKRIPTKAIVASGHKSAAQVKRGRAKAAARIKKEGSAFVANKGSSARRKRAGRRVAAYAAAKRSGKTVKHAKAYALRKVPLQRGDQFIGEGKAPVTTSAGKRTRVRRNKKKTAAALRRLKRNGKGAAKRAKRKLSMTKAAKAARSKRRLAAAGTATTPKRRRKSKATRRKTRSATAKRTKRVRRKAGKSTAPKRRKSRAKTGKRKSRATKRVKRNGIRRQYRKNAFLANLKAVLLSGLFVTSGFLVHRIATNLLADKALKDTLVENKSFQDWKKPIVGAGVLLVGIPAVGAIAPKRAIEIGAGMVASFLQTVIVTALKMPENPNADLLSAFSGTGSYSNSKAYALRGTRRGRRGVRGLEKHAVSIMPRYVPLRGYEQAAAGYEQAAAGFEQAAAGVGEYFTASKGLGEYYTATGEYFAPQGTQGVGGYEPAGQLAMQATAGTNTVIRDGIRPDGDLDRALDVAEAAAGLSEFTERRVGQRSQWIPNGPLWAGERAVTDGQGRSEVSAGILQRPGGNGILSGG